jgi:anti-anti-sigma factor
MDACAPLKAEGSTVVVNCRGVSFVSSSGIGVLLAITEDFRDRGSALWVADPSPEVRMAIGLLNLETYLNIDDTEEGALRRAA